MPSSASRSAGRCRWLLTRGNCLLASAMPAVQVSWRSTCPHRLHLQRAVSSQASTEVPRVEAPFLPRRVPQLDRLGEEAGVEIDIHQLQPHPRHRTHQQRHLHRSRPRARPERPHPAFRRLRHRRGCPGARGVRRPPPLFRIFANDLVHGLVHNGRPLRKWSSRRDTVVLSDR